MIILNYNEFKLLLESQEDVNDVLTNSGQLEKEEEQQEEKEEELELSTNDNQDN